MRRHPEDRATTKPQEARPASSDRRIRTLADLDTLRFGSGTDSGADSDAGSGSGSSGGSDSGGGSGSSGGSDSGGGSGSGTGSASDAGGPLLPVVAQDALSGAVLMLAWANREALARTLESGEMHYWSRSRGELWHKGATSGNTQRLRSLHADCDGDTVLALVEPSGPACHTGETTCFGVTDHTPGWLAELWATLEARHRERPSGSYTARLLDDENLRLKKLGEETAELIHAFAKADQERIPEEAADLLYHLLVALLASGHTLDQVGEALARRR